VVDDERGEQQRREQHGGDDEGREEKPVSTSLQLDLPTRDGGQWLGAQLHEAVGRARRS
jgi:hypothetical protein